MYWNAGENQFEVMKPVSFIVNTSRGLLVNSEALYKSLTSGQIRGTVIDTFLEEPVSSTDSLLTLPIVTLIPHISGNSLRTAKIETENIAEGVRRHLSGESPIHSV